MKTKSATYVGPVTLTATDAGFLPAEICIAGESLDNLLARDFAGKAPSKRGHPTGDHRCGNLRITVEQIESPWTGADLAAIDRGNAETRELLARIKAGFTCPHCGQPTAPLAYHGGAGRLQGGEKGRQTRGQGCVRVRYR